jgi:hypothetical protein
VSLIDFYVSSLLSYLFGVVVILLVSLVPELLIQLAIMSECHHELWRTIWQLVSLIDLPRVHSLAICVDKLLHDFFLSDFRHSWKCDHATLDFVDMTMPVLLLLFRQLFVKLLRDDVLDANQSSIRFITVIDNTLVEVFVDVAAVVMSRNLLLHVT